MTSSKASFEVIGPMTTDLWAKEVGEFSFMLYGKMGWWAFLCPPTWLRQHKCMKISKLWTALTFAFMDTLT